MKIQIPLLNAVRFTTDDDTALHLHNGHVDPLNDNVAEPDVGPKVYLRTVTPADKPPLLDTATPYGHGKMAITAFQFGQDLGEPNYATTARSATPVLPEELDITDELRISLFFRPDASSTGGKALIAGVPGRFGLYQDDRMLILRLKSGGAWTEDLLDYELDIGSWHLLEVQWSKDLNEGRPMWYVNGVRGLTFMDALTSSLDSTGDRFNLAWDSAVTSSPTWQGAIREIELSRKAVWKTDEDGTDAEMRGRAMRLFGLAAHATPVPVFSRASVAWIRVGGVLHEVSQHHPRATALGSLVEEERENLNPTCTSVPALLTLNKGRYTLWFEQESDVGDDPTILSVTVGSEEPEEVEEDEPLVFEVLKDGTSVTITEDGDGTVTHLQVEEGVGPTSHIITAGSTVTRAVETLAYPLTGSDLQQEQGRLDLEITPSLTGVRAEVGEEALAGDILAVSLTRDEIVSVDESDDVATLPGTGLWQTGVTRSFHVEWQPGTRMLSEDSMGLVAGADYSGSWPTGSNYLYVGGSGATLRANMSFRYLVLDDQVERLHADLHRFMVRQFGIGGFSEDEDSTFRRWRRVEGDGLALMARLGDRLKAQAFADSVDLMLPEWEQALGVPTPEGASVEERQALLADLFKAIGATDAEMEERVGYLTGTAAVIERHLGDVGPDLREMYEYYVKIPESSYRDSLLGVLRYLLERQEPAQTVGWPIVRTEFITHSETYGSVKAGPDDDLPFEELSSQTLRDCVGLPSNTHLVPQGGWLPTNESDLKDLWVTSYEDVPEPDVLFPCQETGGNLRDWIGGYIRLSPTGGPEYRRICAGLAVADKQLSFESSSVKLNILRGVELTSTGEYFATDSSAYPQLKIFNLGTYRSGAFLHVFRVTALPESGTEGNLFHCSYGEYFYRVYVDDAGTLAAEFGTLSPYEVATATVAGAAVQTGEWVCALTVIDQEQAGSRSIKLYSTHGGPSAAAQYSGSGSPVGLTTFSLGGPEGASESALAHHAYFAAWVGPYAASVDQTLIDRIWTELNPAYGLVFDRDDGEVQVCWPVDGVPDDSDFGNAAGKTNRGQFPYAAFGKEHDGEGVIRDVRGYGCNRTIRNYAPYSETVESGWQLDPEEGGLELQGYKEAPDGLSRALWFEVYSAFELYTTVAVESGARYLTMSVWVRLVDETRTEGLACRCFARDVSTSPPVELTPLFERPESPAFDPPWQRVSAIFEVPEGATAVDIGLRTTESPSPAVDAAFWGLQVVQEPAIGPYVPNHTGAWSEAGGSVLEFDKDDFPGFQDRGFASLRVKFEERLDLLEDGKTLVLFEASDSSEPILNRALLTVGKNGGTVELKFYLKFQRSVPGETAGETDVEAWQEVVTFNPPMGVKEGWGNMEIERTIAVGWDLSRPVALTGRHAALWVDGERVGTYPSDRPADPMDQKVMLDTVRVGCGVEPDPAESPQPEVGNQPHAVFREVELYTRHHPGLYTPTRLEMREQEEEEEGS